jgi:hypothetical protein
MQDDEGGKRRSTAGACREVCIHVGNTSWSLCAPRSRSSSRTRTSARSGAGECGNKFGYRHHGLLQE